MHVWRIAVAVWYTKGKCIIEYKHWCSTVYNLMHIYKMAIIVYGGCVGERNFSVWVGHDLIKITSCACCG